MKRVIRIAAGAAVLAGGLAIAGAATANAQVRIGGAFRLPHGVISFSVGDPYFPVGSYVPYGYEVYDDPYYGYGFAYEDRWIPCEPHGRRWVVMERPTYYGRRDYRYDRYSRYDRYQSERWARRYRRDDRYQSDRRYDRYQSDRRDDRWRGDRDGRWRR